MRRRSARKHIKMGTPGSRAVVEGLTAFIDAVNESNALTHLNNAQSQMRHGQAAGSNAAIDRSMEALRSAMRAKEGLNEDAARAFSSAAGEHIGDVAANTLLEIIAKSATDKNTAAAAIQSFSNNLRSTVDRARHAIDIIAPLVAPMPTQDDRDTLTIKFAGNASMDSLAKMSSYSKDFEFLVSVMGRVSGNGPESAKIVSVEEGCLEITIAASAGAVLMVLQAYNKILDIRAKNMSHVHALMVIANDDGFSEDIREKVRMEANALLLKQLESIPQKLIRIGNLSNSESKEEMERLLAVGVEKLNKFTEDGGSFSRGSFSIDESQSLLQSSAALLSQGKNAKIAELLESGPSPANEDEASDE